MKYIRLNWRHYLICFRLCLKLNLQAFRHLISHSMLPFRRLKGDYVESKILVYGFGRSGSTLLCNAIAHDSLEHEDLGELLRARKYIQQSIFWPFSPSALIAGAVNAQIRWKKRFVVHVKPYHLDYFKFDAKQFLAEMERDGWMIILLFRNPTEILLSELKARARNQWTLRKNEERIVENFIPSDLSWAQEEVAFMNKKNIETLSIVSGLNRCIKLSYSRHLQSKSAQTSTAAMLKQKFKFDVSFEQVESRKGKKTALTSRDQKLFAELNSYHKAFMNSAQETTEYQRIID